MYISRKLAYPKLKYYEITSTLSNIGIKLRNLGDDSLFTNFKANIKGCQGFLVLGQLCPSRQLLTSFYLVAVGLRGHTIGIVSLWLVALSLSLCFY